MAQTMGKSRLAARAHRIAVLAMEFLPLRRAIRERGSSATCTGKCLSLMHRRPSVVAQGAGRLAYHDT